MSDLRVMTVPSNRIGLGEGTWLRWGELRLWLVERDEKDLADAIDQVLREGEDVVTRAIKVRS